MLGHLACTHTHTHTHTRWASFVGEGGKWNGHIFLKGMPGHGKGQKGRLLVGKSENQVFFLDFLQTFTNINRHTHTYIHTHLCIDLRSEQKYPKKCARLWLGRVSDCVVW